MIEYQIRRRNIADDRVLQVMAQLPRHLFIPPENRSQAYLDQPVPIGLGQTISQPYIVALMTEKLQIQPQHLVLEIGTGCGYQTAILAKLARKVYTIEYLEELSRHGQENLVALGITNVEYRVGNGREGWPGELRFDRILVAAAAEFTPPVLLERLADNGKMVIPIGEPAGQKLMLLEKSGHDINSIRETMLCYCRFVKLV